jgi:hypothetical protein
LWATPHFSLASSGGLSHYASTTKEAQMPKTRTTTFLAEVVQYGPVNVTRADAARLALAATGCRKAVDRFAYAPPAIAVPDGCEPWSYADAARVLRIAA